MLLDVSRLNQVTIDKTTMLATAGPGCRSDEFDDLLAEQDLFFPVGHCQGVGLGGYLLQGGFGWNSRAVGMACESVLALDYVDGDGTIRHASPDENADVYWAAQGAGPGFFGVVTRFHLRLHRRPPVIGARLGIYPVDMFEELLRWTHRVGPTVPNSVELMFVVSRRLPNTGQPGILLIVAVFADTEEQALDDLSFLETRPEAAHQFTPFGQIALQKLTTETMSNYPLDHYHVVDNMWTHASADELLPGLNRVLEALPEPPAHFIWMNWSPKLARSDMAYSLEDETYIALYGLWEDPAQETTVTNWVLDGITDLSPLSSGIQLADENLARRSGPFMAAANRDRLEAIRRERDPAGRFHTYGDVPEVG
jgi:FAD/FMN-containing dehydrogenase